MISNLDNMRRFGVELEFVSNITMHEMADLIFEHTQQRVYVACYSDKSDRWRLKPDCSVRGRNGMELVTPVLHGLDDMELLKKIVNVCNEYGEVNRSCGMHVHVDITGAEATPLRKLMQYFAKYEHAINSVLAPSRRGDNNGYCQNSYSGYEDLWNTFDDLLNRDVSSLLRDRHFSARGKWNFQNYWRQGSVENRAHQGTLDAEKVENWVRLTQGIVARAFDMRGCGAHRGDTTSTYTVKHLLNDLCGKGFITKTTKKFYRKREKELN